MTESVTARKAAELEGISRSTVNRRCEAGRYPGAYKAAINGGEGWTIPPEVLSREAQSKLKAEIIPAPAPVAAPVVVSREECRTMMDAYERKPPGLKRRAEHAATAVAAFLELRESGLSVAMAEKSIANSHGMNRVTLWRARTAIEGHDRQYWEALLCPNYHGGRGKAEFTPEAYEWILARQLSQTKPPLSATLIEARRLAPDKGWTIPGAKTVQARLNEEPAWLIQGGKQGPKALERSYPTVERDYETLRVHEMWESDGRRGDVWCRWPDGSVGRPHALMWRDVRTRMPLSIRINQSESLELVINALGQALEVSGTKPENYKIDNGRAYASKAMTGGQSNRYRFKVKENEPIGVITRLGGKVKWSKPGQGRDKPMESHWRYVGDHCDKSPDFEGAYCGRNPVEKPEGFDARKAVPVEAYAAKLLQVVVHFAQHHRHRGHGMNGKTPFELYMELMRDYQGEPADPAIIRMCRMGMATATLDKQEASLRFKMDGYGKVRYWSEALANLPMNMRGCKFTVYYDVGNPSRPISVYDGERYVCEADNIEHIPFNEAGGEKVAAHMRNKGAYLKSRQAAVKDAKAAAPSGLLELTASGQFLLSNPMLQIAEPHPSLEPPPQPANPIQPRPGHPGEYVDTHTGEVLRGDHLQGPPLPVVPSTSQNQEEQEELEELERQQREKNLPAYLRA